MNDGEDTETKTLYDFRQNVPKLTKCAPKSAQELEVWNILFIFATKTYEYEKETSLNRPVAFIGNYVLPRTDINVGRGRRHHRSTDSHRDSATCARRLRSAL